jgi:hypothetical protein
MDIFKEKNKMNRPIPASGERYRHFKNKMYQIVTVATHSETGEKLVIYQALYGDFGVYARPLDMFMSEVDRDKYPNVKQIYRFEKVQMHEPESKPQISNCEPSDIGLQKLQPSDDKQTSGSTATGEALENVNSKLMEFFDADNLETKYNILVSMRDEIDDTLIDNMAVGLDIVIPDGKVMDRYDELKRCIRTKQQYELNR